MDAVCAWCGKVTRGEGAGVVSHSMCAECAFQLEYRKVPLANLLERLPGPVCAVDGKGQVLAVNQSLCDTLGSDAGEMVSKRLGDVFHCVHAPGGCGETVHCTGCTIRRQVNQIRRTGAARSRVPAYTFVEGPDGPQRLELELSTELLGETVLVRLDSVQTGAVDRAGR